MDKRNHKIIKKSTLEFLYELHRQGIPIGDDDLQSLIKEGYVKEEKEENKFFKEDPAFTKFDARLKIRSDFEQELDKRVEVIEDDGLFADISILVDDGHERIVESSRRIDDSEWMPKSTTVHTQEFIDWINSINNGFENRKAYKKFNLYRQQANGWLSENSSPAGADTPEERADLEDIEIDRCARNTLYFVNKYGKLKEGALVSGIRDYQATPAHEILIYLVDCGYSYYLLKPRQIAATSTFGLVALKRTVFVKNHFIKFVTEDDAKGKEIFADKMTYPFGELPEWMRPKASNDREKLFRLGFAEKKGEKEGVQSKIEVAAPKKTVISGGSPTLSMIDEAGNISLLQEIIQDARPTMYWSNPLTKRIELKRQILVWGTGGEMIKGGKAYESVYMTVMNQWKNNDFTSCIIPIFFDWSTRPGITKEFYDNMKKEFYSVEGPKAKESQILFHQQYPTTVEDAFMTTAKTLVDMEFIEDRMRKIRETFNKEKNNLRPKMGYFEPIFGNMPQPEASDVPFDIVGANFIPTEDNDPRATACIFVEPDPLWANRFYSGTDPIAADNGTSRMSTAIWDKRFQTVAGYVFYRDQDYKYVFLQCTLIGLYYSPIKKAAVKDVLEANLGLAYREYKDNHGFYDSLVFNTELPRYLQTSSGNIVGIDNHGARNRLIIDKMFELIQAYGNNVWMELFFVQLKTFVCTISKTGTTESWGPIDKRYYHDDLLFSVTFAYICSLCFSEPPQEKAAENTPVRVQWKTVRQKDLTLTRVPIRSR